MAVRRGLALMAAYLSAGIWVISCTSVRPVAPSPLAAALDTGWLASTRVPGAAVRDSIGPTNQPGPFLYWYRTAAGIALGPHRHSVAMTIRVLSGRQFILMGNPPDVGRVQHFEAGQTFVIPAFMWHVEWWESETVVEITGQGPMRTERPPAVMPQRP